MRKDRTYAVLTPLMHGPGVKRLQLLLREKGYLEDKSDSIYGIHTGQAVYRAKYWLGYRKPDHIAGKPLMAFLSGDSKPTIAMKLLAAKRRAQAKAGQKRRKGLTKGQQVLKKSLTQIGETEHPAGSNRSKYSIWYGIIGAWCAMFCTWCSVGIFKAWKRGANYAYVPYVRNDAVAGHNGLMVTSVPRSGNYVIYDWDKNGTGDHIGIYADKEDLERFAPKAFEAAVNEFGALKAGEFWAVEGNTGVGNDSNGGEVMIRKRSRSTVQTFVKAS